MATKRMNTKDVEQLLVHYRSERRRLLFQLGQVRKALGELKGIEKTAVKKETPDLPKRGPGRPRKEEGAVKSKYRRKPGRRKKRTIKDGGYKLSPWDKVVTGAIEKKSLLLPKEDLFRETLAWAKTNAPKMKKAEVEVKLTRVLQKLSGKRGVLGTFRSGMRRGYHYGLKDWFIGTNGKLRPAHRNKVEIKK
ncbi:MAG: hypothetical protein IPP83_05435 [Flavobacteriales bacterium]|nr:hypothetical protein [Flavobacteriales bacterium]